MDAIPIITMNRNRGYYLHLTLGLYCSFYSITAAWTTSNSGVCEVYYINSYRTFSDAVTCIHGDEFDPSAASKVIRNDCEVAATSSVSGRVTEFTYVNQLKSVGCNLTLKLFKFLPPLPYVKLFNSKRNLGYLTSEQSNYSSVLTNNTLKGLCSLEAIDLSYSDLGTLESSAFRCLKAVKFLNLSNNGIESLPPGLFREMTELERLQLGDNRLGELSPESFVGLTSLLVLELHSNAISDLPEGIFRQLRSLKTLLFSENHLTHLNKDVFVNLADLVHLELASNRLTYLGNVFSGNGNLQYLDISWNHRLKLAKDTFHGLNSLRTLSFERCGLDLLQREMFLGLSGLTDINAHENKLREINPDTFASLWNANELVLSYNRIESLRGAPFRSLYLLQVLVLSDNKISYINANALLGLFSLKTLDLSRNLIRDISGGTFDDLRNLERLDLSGNLISSLHDLSARNRSLLWKLTDLEQLCVANNFLEIITRAFFYNENLLSLVISRNPHLKLDDQSFAGLHGLKKLHMEYCNLSHLPASVFADLLSLQTLHLDNNRIKEVAAYQFVALRQLRRLYLDFNKIARLGETTFIHGECLRELRLSNNRLSRIRADDFRGLSSLRLLDLSSNQIGKISDGSFDGLQNLTILNVSHNRLTDVSNVHWWRMQNLFQVWAFTNELRELNLSHFMALSDMVVFHLESNNIRRVHVGDSEMLSESKFRIYLSGNPLVCDCHAYAFYQYIRGHPSKFPDNILCRFAEQHQSRELTSLKAWHFSCAIKDRCPGNCSCVQFGQGDVRMVNCSASAQDALPTEVPSNSSLLLVDQNRLTSLTQLDEPLWENLTVLHAENNFIEELHYVPPRLKYLGLRGNALKAIPSAIQRQVLELGDFKVSLSGNPWPCDCSLLPIKSWLVQNQRQVLDAEEVRCIFDNGSVSHVILVGMEDIDICPNLSIRWRVAHGYIDSYDIVVTFIVIAVIIFMVASFYVVCRKF